MSLLPALDTIRTRCVGKLLKTKETTKVRISPSPPASLLFLKRFLSLRFRPKTDSKPRFAIPSRLSKRFEYPPLFSSAKRSLLSLLEERSRDVSERCSTHTVPRVRMTVTPPSSLQCLSSLLIGSLQPPKSPRLRAFSCLGCHPWRTVRPVTEADLASCL